MTHCPLGAPGPGGPIPTPPSPAGTARCGLWAAAAAEDRVSSLLLPYPPLHGPSFRRAPPSLHGLGSQPRSKLSGDHSLSNPSGRISDSHFPTAEEQVAFVSQGPGQAPQGTRPCGKPASSSIVFPLWVWLFHSLDWACTSSLGSGWRGSRFRPVSAAYWALYYALTCTISYWQPATGRLLP